MWAATGDIFGNGQIHYITEVDDSKALNDRGEPMVIIASSGMCEAGRILHHLKNNVEDERNTVIVVGYMAQHTLGRRIVERREEFKIFGRMYKLLARVEVLNGFSAHADADEFHRLFAPIAKGLKRPSSSTARKTSPRRWPTCWPIWAAHTARSPPPATGSRWSSRPGPAPTQKTFKLSLTFGRC